MATLAEIWTIVNNATTADRATATGDALAAVQLLDRIEAALWVKINSLASVVAGSGDLTAREALAWARQAAGNSRPVAIVVLRILIGANAGATVAQILGATDAALQTKIDAVVPQLARGLDVSRS